MGDIGYPCGSNFGIGAGESFVPVRVVDRIVAEYA